jgi:hypothetical protein
MRHLPGFPMLAAINFDYQPRGQAHKVREIGSQRKLAPEAQPIELLLAQEAPQILLRL